MFTLLKKISRYLIITLFVIIASALLYLFIGANISPKEQTLNAPGGLVIIRRDGADIPHIRALHADNDAFFALGYVHAQDRFWQMEFQRRVASGRLSEIFGRSTIKQDEYLRTWGFYHAAIDAWNGLDEKTRLVVHAYTMGVNAYLSQGKLPLQISLLRYRPEPWTDVDSIAWQKMMAWNLDTSWELKVKNSVVAKKYGVQALTKIFPDYPATAPTVLSDLDLQQAGLISSTKLPENNKTTLWNTAALKQKLILDKEIRRKLGFQNTPGKGSNSWVVSGKFTKSGKPILANDPHLALASPALWYQAELRGPTLHVIGATIPGLPVVIIGHNEHIAWGVTSGYVDSQDLYVENNHAAITIRKEIIRIKGETDETLLVKSTLHGPIISDVTDAKQVAHSVALKWVALQPGDTTVKSFIELNYAHNWNEFTQALQFFVTPSQNFLYADTEGNIGYYLPGKIPVRIGWTGALPVAPTEHHEWNGYIPFSRLPHVYNPSEGYLVSANNRIASTAYPYSLTFRWSVPPFRAERIIEMLQKNRPLTISNTMMIQTDTRSTLWLALRDSLLNTSALDLKSKIALDLLTSWDGNMDVTSKAASIFSYWYQDLIASPLQLDDFTLKADALTLLQALQNNACYREGVALNCKTYLSESLQRAMSTLIKKQGESSENWQWGKVHHVVFEELAIGKSKALGWLWNRDRPARGGDYTVDVGTYDAATMNQTAGASYRQVIDLNDFNNSFYVIPLGERDNPFNFHYNNQLESWIKGQYIPMQFSLTN
jgi:penicillin amidase